MTRYYCHTKKEKKNHRIQILIGILFVVVILASCVNYQVPGHVDLSGKVEHILKIELVVPEEILNLFKEECNNQCNSDQTCIDQCSSLKEQDYTGTLLKMIHQLQSSMTNDRINGTTQDQTVPDSQENQNDQ